MLAASFIALASFLVGQAAAHGGVVSYIIDGEIYINSQITRLSLTEERIMQALPILGGSHSTPRKASRRLEGPTVSLLPFFVSMVQ